MSEPLTAAELAEWRDSCEEFAAANGSLDGLNAWLHLRAVAPDAIPRLLAYVEAGAMGGGPAGP